MKPYTLTTLRKTLSTDEFYNKYNNYEKTQGFCRECFNYNQNYSCSPLDINIQEYITSFDNVDIIITKLDFTEDVYNKKYSQDELNSIINDTFMKEKNNIKQKLLDEEKNYIRSESITGPCTYCKEDFKEEFKTQVNCKDKFDKCLHPEHRRYSLSALGFDSEVILEDLFDINLILIKPGILPRYMNNISAILYDQK